MMITAKEVSEALVAIDNHYIEKTGSTPNYGAHLRIASGDERWECELWMKSCTLPNYSISATGETIEDAIKALRDAIDGLPSEEERNLREFQGDLGRLIDKGRAYGIDVDFVNPLIATAKRLAENAITDQRASV
jgi:ABC-type phosphate/phosphonate transport system substrate-binding protein